MLFEVDSMIKWRFWYERFNPLLIIKSGVLRLLKKYNVSICFASTRENYNKDLAELAHMMNEYGLSFCLWPLLPDELGYWVSTYNAGNFLKELEIIFSWASQFDVKVDEIAIDLETPIWMHKEVYQLNMIKGIMRFYRIGRKFYDRGVSILAEARDVIKSNGALTLVPVIDALLELSEEFSEKLQITFGTPVYDIKWDIISPMIYNSMWHGYLGIPLNALRYRMYEILRKEVKEFGNRAGVSIGVIWTGKLGNEPIYNHPEELAVDAGIAKAAGVKDIAIYNLEGLIFRNNDERWIKYPVMARPEKPQKGKITYKMVKLGLSLLDTIGNLIIR